MTQVGISHSEQGGDLGGLHLRCCVDNRLGRNNLGGYSNAVNERRWDLQPGGVRAKRKVVRFWVYLEGRIATICHRFNVKCKK